tara:strand:+ start:37 stop:231 length:195 start_codon:yes stop_codon:yes gene_type:complete
MKTISSSVSMLLLRQEMPLKSDGGKPWIRQLGISWTNHGKACSLLHSIKRKLAALMLLPKGIEE